MISEKTMAETFISIGTSLSTIAFGYVYNVRIINFCHEYAKAFLRNTTARNRLNYHIIYYVAAVYKGQSE